MSDTIMTTPTREQVLEWQAKAWKLTERDGHGRFKSS